MCFGARFQYVANNKHEEWNSIIKALRRMSQKNLAHNTTALTFNASSDESKRGERKNVHTIWCLMPDTHSIMSRMHKKNDLLVNKSLAAKKNSKRWGKK